MCETDIFVETENTEEVVKELSNDELTANAKVSIKEHGYSKIFGFMFVLFLCLIVAGGFGIILGQGVQIIAQWMITLIASFYVLCVVDRKNFDMNFVQTCFVRIGTIIGVSALSTLIIFLPIIIASLVALIVSIPIILIEGEANVSVLSVVFTIPILIGAIFSVILGYRYRLVYFIMAEDKLLPVSTIIKRSHLLMEGHKKQGFFLDLRYAVQFFMVYIVLIAMFLIGAAKIVPLFVSIILITLSVIFSLIYLVKLFIRLFVAWAEFYKNLRSINSHIYLKDEELYPNYKMSKVNTFLLVIMIILYGLIGVLL